MMALGGGNGRAAKNQGAADDVSGARPGKLAHAAAVVGRSQLARSVRRSMKRLVLRRGSGSGTDAVDTGAGAGRASQSLRAGLAGSRRSGSRRSGGGGSGGGGGGGGPGEWPQWTAVRARLSEEFAHALDDTPLHSEVALHAWMSDAPADDADERWAALLEHADADARNADAAAECLGLLPRGEDVIDMAGRGALVLMVCASGRAYALRRPARADAAAAGAGAARPRELLLPELAGSRVAQAACSARGAALLSADGRAFLLAADADLDFNAAREAPLPQGEPVVQVVCDAARAWALGASGRVFDLGAPEAAAAGRAPARQLGGALRGVAVASLAAGAAHCVAVSASGRVYGWGDNACGQLGAAPERAQSLPQPRRVPVPFPVARAACGDAHTVLAGRPGAWVWLGRGAPRSAEAAAFFERAELDIAHVACGPAHAVVLAETGELFVVRGAGSPQQLALEGGADGGCFLAACCGALSFALRSGSGGGGGAAEAAARRARVQALAGRALPMAWVSGGDLLRAAQGVASGADADTAQLEQLLALALKDAYTVGGAFPTHLPRAAAGASARARKLADAALEATAAADAGGEADAAAEEPVESMQAGDGPAASASTSARADGTEAGLGMSLPERDACAEADDRIGSGVDLEGLNRSLFAAVKTLMRASFAKHRDHRAFKTLSALADGASSELAAAAADTREPDALRGLFLLLVSPLAVTARAEHDRLALAAESVLPRASARLLHRWIFWEVPGDMLGRYLVARTVDAVDELIHRRQLGSPDMRTLCRLARRLYLLNDERWKEALAAAGGVGSSSGGGSGGGGADGAEGGARALAAPSQQPLPRELFCTRNLLRASPDFVRGYFDSWRRSRGQRNAPFSLMRYPFLLSADLKTELLKIEDEETMRRTVMAAGLGFSGRVPYFVLQVRRDKLLDDTIQQLGNARSAELKRPLMVVFHNGGRPEEGQDAGGVKKEFFQLLSAQLFSADFAMFAPVGANFRGARAGAHNSANANANASAGAGAGARAQLWFNVSPSSAVLAADAGMFNLVGKLLGLAMYNGTILDMNFVQTFYRMLLGKLGDRPGLHELEELNPELASGLSQMLEWRGDDFEDVFMETFEAPAHATLSGRPEPLCEGGADRAVTTANRREFVELYAKYLLVDAVQPMTGPLLEGFHTLIPPDLASLSLFRPDELELALTGSSVMDFDALRESTTYVGGFSLQHRTVKWFWEVVETLSDAQKHELIRFATGAPKPPVGGMAALHFVLQRAGPDSDQLPTASTCFNTLLLPEYSSKDKLRDRLLLAIQNAQGFGLK